MISLIKKSLLLILSLMLAGCSFVEVKQKPIEESAYPTEKKLKLVIDPPYLVSAQNNNTAPIEHTMKYLKELLEDKDIFDINKTHYSDRFEKILLSKSTKDNVRKVKETIETLSAQDLNQDFEKNGIIESIIWEKEPIENVLKVGFEIIDKPFPMIRGYRSIKEEGKSRYTEYIVLQNKLGNSHNYQDMQNLIHYFFIKSIQKTQLNIHSAYKYSVIKEVDLDSYIIKNISYDNTFFTRKFLQPILKNDFDLAATLGLFDSYAWDNITNIYLEKYCQLFDMSTPKINTFYDSLSFYKETGAKLLTLEKKKNFTDKILSIEDLYCEDEYRSKEESYHSLYLKDTLDRIITNQYILKDIKVHSSPILDISKQNSNIYSVHLDGFLSKYDTFSDEKEKFKITKNIPLYSLETNNEYAVMGSSDGMIYFFSLQKNKIVYTLKAHESKVTALKIYDKNLLFSASDDGDIKMWNLTNRKLINKVQKAHDFIIRDIDIYENKLLSVANDIKVWNINDFKLLLRINTDKVPIRSMSIGEKKLDTLSSNNQINTWNLQNLSLENSKKIDVKNETIVSDFIKTNNNYFIGFRNGVLQIVSAHELKFYTPFDGFGKITKLFYDGSKIYLANHEGRLYIFDSKLWEALN